MQKNCSTKKMELIFEFTKARFASTCRSCLNQDGPFLGTEASNVFEIYTKITGIEIFPLDEIPQVICVSCGETLKYIREFIELCKSSDESLRDELRKFSQNETEHIKEEIVKNEPVEITEEFELKEEIIDLPQPSVTEVKEEEEEPSVFLPQRIKNESNVISKKRLVFMCGTCGKYFPNVKLRALHYSQSTSCKKNEYKCNECDKIFKFHYVWKNHMKSHTREKKFECDICFKRFVYRHSFWRHRKIHLNIKRYQCLVCHKEFSEVTKKEEHMRTMHSLTCKCCNVEFKNYSALRRHLFSYPKHDNDGTQTFRRIECPECGMVLTNKNTLKKHMMRHKGEKNFVCNVCGKTFYNKATLDGHLRIHTGEKPYECTECDKRFTLKTTLNVHRRRHKGLKAFACKLCDKSFVQSTQLKRHQQTHTGEKPYACTFCDRRFAQKSNLETHTRIHTGETLYPCSVCFKRFYDSSSLKKHQKKHIDESSGVTIG